MSAFTARTQVTTPLISNPVPEHAVVNTFHFTMDTTTMSTQAPLIAEELENVYEAIIGRLSDEYNWGAQMYRFYNLDDPEPRAPFYEAQHGTGVAPTTQASLPRQIALCGSFQGFKASGVNQARRRGRAYFGPFGIDANTDGRPSSTLRTALASGLLGLLTASDASSEWTWVVRSEVAGTTIPVDNGWVDDVWDTQRRRAPAQSARNVFS